jgi:hypothetical protein
MKNQFENDTERIQELKTCLEKSHNLLHNANKMEDVYGTFKMRIVPPGFRIMSLYSNRFYVQEIQIQNFQ